MKNKTLRLSQQAIILVSVPLAFELAFVGTLNNLVVQAETAALRADRARAIIDDASSVCKLSYDAVNALFTYMREPQNPAHKQSYLKAKGSIPPHLEKLKKEVAARPKAEQESAERLAHATKREFVTLDEVEAAIEAGDRLRAMRASMSFYGFENPLSRMAAELEYLTAQEEIDARNEKESQSRRHIINLLWIGVAVNILLAGFLVAYFNRSTLQRLSTLMDNARRLPKKEALNEPVGGSDEIAELDDVFHETAQTLQQVDKLKQEFVAMVSHDLRTPLTSLLATLTMLSKGAYGELNELGKVRLQGSEASIKHLIKLINELLDLEKLDSGKLDLQLDETAIEVVIERAVQSVRSFAETQGVKLETANSDAVIQADADRLVQVLTNLLSNAIKFSARNSEVKITVLESNDWVEVRVSDQGRGIPESHLESVFDRFQQVAQDDSKVKGGSGLGLAIAKAIIEQHGGQIGVDSKEGSGSTFWFRLPNTGAIVTSSQSAVCVEGRESS